MGHALLLVVQHGRDKPDQLKLLILSYPPLIIALEISFFRAKETRNQYFSGNQKWGAQSGAQLANYMVRNREINSMEIQFRAGPGEKLPHLCAILKGLMPYRLCLCWCAMLSKSLVSLWLAVQWGQRTAPGKYLRTLKCCAIGGAQWQKFPTGRGAQSPRSALKQLLRDQGAQWSHVGTVLERHMYPLCIWLCYKATSKALDLRVPDVWERGCTPTLSSPRKMCERASETCVKANV